MTQKDKEILIKDLCSRLPYGIIVEHVSGIRGTLHDLFVTWFYGKNDEIFKYEANTMFFGDVTCDIIKFKPYLFPISSMTKEQKEEFDQLFELELKAINDEIDHIHATAFEVDFYNKHHFDWRGLIPLDLALDATGLNIY